MFIKFCDENPEKQPKVEIGFLVLGNRKNLRDHLCKTSLQTDNPLLNGTPIGMMKCQKKIIKLLENKDMKFFHHY